MGLTQDIKAELASLPGRSVLALNAAELALLLLLSLAGVLRVAGPAQELQDGVARAGALCEVG